ncbi:hypothetical protein AAFF_G00414160 [Aldrovandia affinis]|uniref:ribonuclease H n=1 Tax=Aldrovandia affinis TaxID=143900 RepID=A0AAD7VYC4_9TELE|nr:hypothetical protein AAFF_G00414160 [Aldrovandia affinis]
MLFDLCNSPTTFKRLMEKILQPVPASACVVYLDDILVHKFTYTVVLTNLRTVFQLIAKANLHLNPAKCSLFRQHTSFLGHLVSERGVSTDPAKVEVVEKWSAPTSTGEVRSFLGLASYYQRFIAVFANIARPLHQLTEKGQRFTWSPASQNAFSQLRKALITAPILAIPDPTKSFLLDVTLA